MFGRWIYRKDGCRDVLVSTRLSTSIVKINNASPYSVVQSLRVVVCTGLLAPHRLPFLTPWEVHHRNDKEAVARVRNTREGVIPSRKRSQNAKRAAGIDAGLVGMLAIVLQVADTQQQESQVEGEEQEEKGDCRLQSAEEEDEGEDEPADEEQADVVEQAAGALGFFQGGFDGEAAGGEEDGEGDPETAVGGEGGGAEGVADCHFPGERVSNGGTEQGEVG